MFELTVALKYLLPRWRQLSVSIISFISVLVIALVVWLILVFFSVTNGLEENWIGKLVSMTAPVRVMPTDAYYKSYYYQIDSISQKAGFTYKSLREKSVAGETDPYDAYRDDAIPEEWPEPDRDSNYRLKDLVQLLLQSTKKLNLQVTPFETSMGTLHLNLVRGSTKTVLTQNAFLSSLDPQNTAFYQGGAIPKRGVVEGLLLPKSFKEGGVEEGDSGELSYHVPTTSSYQEQRIPIYVAGFYDQGVIPIGGRLVWVNPHVVAMTNAAYDASEGTMMTGFNVRVDRHQAEKVKKELESALKSQGIAPYWKVETYREYPFTKDLIQQLGSEKNLFSLISVVIVIVACSNIISMLIILVNDKRKEIGILRSMGASSMSIAAIFGGCGVIMGLVGSLLGLLLALLTLQNLHALVELMGRMQGHELFNATYFGDTLPTALSGEALTFVVVTTVCTSLIAGIIPAIKASIVQPAAILRSE